MSLEEHYAVVSRSSQEVKLCGCLGYQNLVSGFINSVPFRLYTMDLHLKALALVTVRILGSKSA